MDIKKNTRGLIFRQQQGITLVELIIVIVLLGIISTIGVMMINNGVRAYTTSRELIAVSEQARLAMERISRDLREVRTATAADLTILPNQITFFDDNGAMIVYSLVGTTLMRREQPPPPPAAAVPPQPLADGVSNLQFTYLQADGKTTAVIVTDVYYITAELTFVSGGVSKALRSTVHPRNF